MAKRLLSEPDAWREIAKSLLCPSIARHVEGYLCVRIADLLSRALIGEGASDAMGRRIYRHLRGKTFAYPSPVYVTARYAKAVREARAMAALWLALEAEAEETTNA